MYRIALTLLTSMFLLTAGPASAQNALCGDRAEFLSKLSSRYSEVPVAMGIANNGTGLVEMLMSRGGESWTIILTMPNGDACVIAAGESWQSLPTLSRLDPPA